MSITQMCNYIIPEAKYIDINKIPHELTPLDEDKFAKVKESLIRERDAYRKNNPRGAVTFSDSGYQFWNGRAKGSVIVELLILKNTNPEFKTMMGR